MFVKCNMYLLVYVRCNWYIIIIIIIIIIAKEPLAYIND